MGKLYLDPAAEREATDIGKKFMHSSDVVGDMSRAYNADLSSVKIHTDSAAASMTEARGVDAFSTGSDVFFGKGIYDSSNPASRGLLAHELSHSIQQGIGGSSAMTQSAPMGAEQGGMFSWFTSLFSKKDKSSAKKKKNKPLSPKQKAELEKKEWEAAKAKKLAELDAEDKRAEDWKTEAEKQSELTATAMELGYDGNVVREQPNEDDYTNLNLTDLLRQAKEKDWKREGTVNKSIDFDADIIENFFREASGEGLRERDSNDNGDRIKAVYTGRRSLDEMMEVFNGHDEQATLNFIRPLMEFSPKEYVERFPLHKMKPEERLAVYPELIKESDKLIGIKQWAEKYGVTTLSEANRKKLDRQVELFMKITNWYLGLYIPQQQASISQIYEQDIKHLNGDTIKHYESGYLRERTDSVMKELGMEGDEMSFDEFEKYAGKLMNTNGTKEKRIFYLSLNMPGLSYNKDTDTVVCPIPKADLKALSKGDMKTLNKYANKLKTMSWREESGRVRRAGMYESTDDEFDANYENDMKYFGDMATVALMLKKFGTRKFFEKQNKNGDYEDLLDRMSLAASTNDMMHERASSMGSMHSYLYSLQFGNSRVKSTWIKRQLLESENVVSDSEKRRVISGKDASKTKREVLKYHSDQGRAVATMLRNAKNLDPELLKDQTMIDLVMKTFESGFSDTLKDYESKDFDSLAADVFRNSESGELFDYNTIVGANSGSIIDRLVEIGADREITPGVVEECLNAICDYIESPGNPVLGMIMRGVNLAKKSKHFKDDPQKLSMYMINNYVLRAICPVLTVDKNCSQLSKGIMVAVNKGGTAASDRLRDILIPLL